MILYWYKHNYFSWNDNIYAKNKHTAYLLLVEIYCVLASSFLKIKDLMLTSLISIAHFHSKILDILILYCRKWNKSALLDMYQYLKF